MGESEFLECRNAITINESDASAHVTVCGLLLFGSEPAIERFFPGARLVYHRLPGNEFRRDPGQRRGDYTQNYSKCLTMSVPAMIRQILDDLFVTTSYAPDSPLERIDTTEIGYRIVRECLVNAVTHRSYHETAPVHIIRYGNRLVVRNPGHSLMPLSRLGSKKSRCRNEKISAGLRAIKWAENLGLGISVLRDKMKEAGLPVPVFDNDKVGDFFTTMLILEPFNEADVKEWLQSDLPDITFDSLDCLVAFYAYHNGAINQSMVQSINFDDDEYAAEKLRWMVDVGVLMKVRGAAGHYYKLTETLSELWNPLTNRLRSDAGAAKNEARTLKHDAEKLKNDGSDEDLSPDHLDSLLEHVRGKRPSNEFLGKVILELCAWNPLSLSGLAKYLGRQSTSTLYTNHICRLVAEKHLEFTIPDNPRHPDQRYKITSEGQRYLLMNPVGSGPE